MWTTSFAVGMPVAGPHRRGGATEVQQSTSRIGSCLDDAAAESFFATTETGTGA